MIAPNPLVEDSYSLKNQINYSHFFLFQLTIYHTQSKRAIELIKALFRKTFLWM